jgi:NAD(P)-dependent dehydrogenase (short-subunit alcohol dehydrogenase family)
MARAVGTLSTAASRADFWVGLVAQHGGEEEAARREGASGTPLKRFAESEEAAQAILYLASDAASYVTRTKLMVDVSTCCARRPQTADA